MFHYHAPDSRASARAGEHEDKMADHAELAALATQLREAIA